MLSKSLTKVLDLGAWKLGLVAWIFTGYSPLKLKKTGHIIRLVDDLEIPHGTTEFRDAQKEQKEILSLLNQNVGEAQGFIFTPSDDGENADIWIPNHHFDRNWLINQVVNGFGLKERITPWWLDSAIELHLLPAYIRPDAISPSVLEHRGYNSFQYPHEPDEIINPPELIPLKSVVEGKAEIRPTWILQAKGEVIKTLYQPSAVEPQTKFYKLLHEKIKEQITVVPEKQFEGFPPIEGWGKHCKPRPTGKEVFRIAEKILLHDKRWKRKVLETDVSLLAWQELNQRDDEGNIGLKEVIRPLDKGHASREVCANLVDRWFDRTEAGHEYLKHIKEIKRSG